MRWKGRERSTNVEDRRMSGPAGAAIGGGGCLVIIVALVAIFLGADPQKAVDLVGPPQQQAGGAGRPAPGPDDEAREFVEVVLNDTEKVWAQLFRDHVRGGAYKPPKLVLFSRSVQSGCGLASGKMGPFYCPRDQQVYIDPIFFDELEQRHQAPGDFAQAYVIAHEISHHVQNLLGLNRDADRARRSGNQRAANQASVRLELQADYLAGVWAHHAQRQFGILEEGDIAEAMNAANQIGDDTLQEMATGYVIPERFTHGTSAQRVRWFTEGLRSGDLDGCQRLFELDYSEL